MKVYQYQVEHTSGSASGSLQAETKKAARAQLSELYETEYKDGDGKKQKVKIKKVVLEELGD